MRTYSAEKTIVIPIKINTNGMEYFYGGPLPAFKNGAIGDLIVPINSVLELDKFQKIRSEKIITILEKNCRLLVNVQPEPLANSRLFRPKDRSLLRGLVGEFVEIVLNEDLNLKLRGTKKAKLVPSACEIPVLKKKAHSVNHAYSIVSGVFEKSRISHTGNVFQKVFYWSEKEEWRPLDTLREKFEAELAQSFTPIKR